MASELLGERFTILSTITPEDLFDADFTTEYMSDAGLGDPAMQMTVLAGQGRLGAFAMSAFPIFEDATQSSLLPESSDPPFPPTYPYFFSTAVVYGREKMNTVIRLVRGDTYIFNVEVLLDGAAYNLTGVTLSMTAKWFHGDTDGNAIFQKTIGDGISITSASDGEFQVTIAPADTNTLPAEELVLKYDIEMRDGSAVYTVARGDLMVIPDVTEGT